MGDWEYLKEVLEASIKKNGDRPLTTQYLLNIMKLAEKKAERDGYLSDLIGDDPNY